MHKVYNNITVIGVREIGKCLMPIDLISALGKLWVSKESQLSDAFTCKMLHKSFCFGIRWAQWSL